MIAIDYQNTLEKTLGKRQGLSEKELQAFLKNHQKTVQNLFKNRNKDGYGFLNLPDNEALVGKIHRFVTSQKKEKWEHLVVLGIGGSALGLLALQEALLDPFAQKPELQVVDNIDPVRVSQLLRHLKLSKSLFIVISKSGTTVEPMVLYSLFRLALENQGIKKWQNHFVFITDPKEGLLRKLAEKEGVFSFPIPPTVGGRFSVLSSVGLVPAALAGIDIHALLKGARQMREELQKKEEHANPALLLAALQYLLDTQKGKNITVMMPYSSLLFRFGDWYRQLLAESIGKNESTGPTPLTALGSTDQHSQIQLYREGPNNKFLLFITIEKPAQDPHVGHSLPKAMDFLNGKSLQTILQAAYLGTNQALAQAHRPNLTLTLPALDAFSLGALFLLFEVQVALLGELYDVNAFNQPGVEAGKKITKHILNSQ